MQRYRPYLAAVILAFLMTVFIAPEVQEGNAMSPLLSDGDVVVFIKGTYSDNRGMPEKGELVVLGKGSFGEDYEEDNPIRKVSGLPGDTVKMEDGSSILIKENEIFVISENPVEEMETSKIGIGPIDSKEIRGRVIVRLWPLDSLGGF